MNFSKLWIVGWLVMSVFQITPAVDAHEKKARHNDTETVWESDRLFTFWFGNVNRIRLGHDGVLAEWVIVKAGEHWDLKVDQITVKYLDPNHDHPVRKNFYPYERIRRGGQVRFKLPEPRRIISIKVITSGWSGSRARDGFRIILKKNTHRPPLETIRTGYFYGQCIGGRRCPGYRRTQLKSFTIDLEDVRNIKRIQFYSHDNIGSSHNAKISVYVDDERVAHLLNIKSRGSVHILDLNRGFGRYITFEATHQDEAVVQRITVDYRDLPMEKRRKHHYRPKHHKPQDDHGRHEPGRHGRHDNRNERGNKSGGPHR